VIAPDRNYDRLSGHLGNVLQQQAYATQAARLCSSNGSMPSRRSTGHRCAATRHAKRQIAALELRITQKRRSSRLRQPDVFHQPYDSRRQPRNSTALSGRGHTDTDLFVYLPRERVVCTGDMMESGLSYMPDAW